MTRTEFLREQTLSGENKCRRTPLPPLSVADLPCSLPERKAYALKELFEKMPIYIGPKELIVGTRTFYTPLKGNEDGHDRFAYSVKTHIPYVTEEEIRQFGGNHSYRNKTHYTPDFGIILNKGINGILKDVAEKEKEDGLHEVNRHFLTSVRIAYQGFQQWILRYAAEAKRLAEVAEDDREELLEISRVCRKVSTDRPETFREAVQLFWFAQLGTVIESFEQINYGRLDVILGDFLKDTPKKDARQLLECLILKMNDQVDLTGVNTGEYSAQLVLTLGGVLPNGENAVNDVTLLYLEAVGNTRMPEPEVNLRIHSTNPPSFLEKASELTVSGCNFVSYYNDNLFVESLIRAGIPAEYARCYGFDLCQDINIPGIGDFYALHSVSLAFLLMDLLKNNQSFETYDCLQEAFLSEVFKKIATSVARYNGEAEHFALYEQGKTAEFFDEIHKGSRSGFRGGSTPMCPLPLLSALYHGCIERAADLTYVTLPLPNKGIFFGTATEAINSLAAIKKAVYTDRRFTLEQVYEACASNYAEATGELIRTVLWNCPKWGNDDPFVDDIAKDVLERCLKECMKYETYPEARVLGGIHQPHPVWVGQKLMATPEGRKAGRAVAVTLTPESGTMNNGPTAALSSAAKIDPMLVQWNYCVMVNYFASVFRGNNGAEVFRSLLEGYFRAGGLQHQPNVSDAEELKQAQQKPEKYKDLIVRLWGVSARFVDIPKNLQDEMIERFS